MWHEREPRGTVLGTIALELAPMHPRVELIEARLARAVLVERAENLAHNLGLARVSELPKGILELGERE